MIVKLAKNTAIFVWRWMILKTTKKKTKCTLIMLQFLNATGCVNDYKVVIQINLTQPSVHEAQNILRCFGFQPWPFVANQQLSLSLPFLSFLQLLSLSEQSRNAENTKTATTFRLGWRSNSIWICNAFWREAGKLLSHIKTIFMIKQLRKFSIILTKKW